MKNDNHNYEVNPIFTYRIQPKDILNYHANVEALFKNGDYILSAQIAEENTEISGCALVLAGFISKGIATLSKIDRLSEDGLLCLAYAYWATNNTIECREVLTRYKKKSLRIDQFKKILDLNEIQVFVTGAMLPIFDDLKNQCMVEAIRSYEQFTLKYVASQNVNNAYDYSYNEDFDKFVESLPEKEKPDLFYSQSPQWILPTGFEKIKQPKVLWLHDSDEFVYRSINNLCAYDIGITGCSHEHFEFYVGTNLFVASNILSNPLNFPILDQSYSNNRGIDIFFSGSSLGNYHTEKSRFIYQVAQLDPKFNIVIADGHFAEAEYFNFLKNTKFLPLIGRIAGAPSPRWREALAHGAHVLYPNLCGYNLFDDRCKPYSTDTLLYDIEKNLSTYSESENQISELNLQERDNKNGLRYKEFLGTRDAIVRNQLKYVTFLSKVWRPKVCDESSSNFRIQPIWLTPGIDCGIYGRAPVIEKIQKAIEAFHIDELSTAQDYNNIALTQAKIYFNSKVISSSIDDIDYYENSSSLFEKGISLFPNILALQYNSAVMQYCAKIMTPSEIIYLFEGILNKSSSGYDFDPLQYDIAFPHCAMNASDIFPYYDYMDATTKELINRNCNGVVSCEITISAYSIIIASCYAFIGSNHKEMGNVEKARGYFRMAYQYAPSIYNFNKLYFSSLIDAYADSGHKDKELINKIEKIYFNLVNIYPAILLSHVHIVATILVDNEKYNSAAVLIGSWYKLARTLHSDNAKNSKYLSMAVIRGLIPLKKFFPRQRKFTLNKRALFRRRAIRTTPVDRLLDREYIRYMFFKWAPITITKDWRRLVGVAQSSIEVYMMLPAFFKYLRLAPNIKKYYRYKAIDIYKSSGFKSAMATIIEWYKDSG